MTLFAAKRQVSNKEKCPCMNQGVHSQHHHSFQEVVLKLKNHSWNKSKVSKKMVQVTCPMQQNGIDCGLFAVIMCLHIFEGTHIGPHILHNMRFQS